MEGAKKLLDDSKAKKGETVWEALDVFSKRREMYAVLQAPEEEGAGGMLGGLTNMLPIPKMSTLFSKSL